VICLWIKIAFAYFTVAVGSHLVFYISRLWLKVIPLLQIPKSLTYIINIVKDIPKHISSTKFISAQNLFIANKDFRSLKYPSCLLREELLYVLRLTSHEAWKTPHHIIHELKPHLFTGALMCAQLYRLDCEWFSCTQEWLCDQ